METIPPALAEVAADLGASPPVRSRHGFGAPRGEWTIQLVFLGYYPIPSIEESFGKQSSSIVGVRGSISCAEVEVSRQLRRRGWSGGWVNSYVRGSGNRTFPDVWLPSTITPDRAERLFGAEYPGIAVPLAEAFQAGYGGTPDVLVMRGASIVAIECKRLAGWYVRNDATPKRYGGDGPQDTQVSWLRRVRALGFRESSYLVLDWCRRDALIPAALLRGP